MRSRRISAASFVLAATMVATAALAAPGVSPQGDASLRLVPLNDILYPALGSVADQGATFDYTSKGISVSGKFVSLAPPLLSADLMQPDTMQLDTIAVSARVAESATLDLVHGRGLAAAVRPGTYSGLFLSQGATNSPYLSLLDGGSYVGATFELASNLDLRLGYGALNGFNNDPVLASLPRDFALRMANGYKTGAAIAGLNWNFAPSSGIDLSAMRITENRSVLGAAPTAIGTAADADTTSLGISARVGFGEGWVTTVSYNAAITQLDLSRSGFSGVSETLKSQAYGIAVAKHNLFGDDALGIAVSRPLQVYGGTGDLAAAGLAGTKGSLIMAPGTQNFGQSGLSSGSPESDFELGYVTTFLNGALALQANAGYQVNSGGQRGTDAVSVLSRAKINF